MTTESQQYNQKDEITLKELLLKIQEWWRYLLSRWLLIFTFGLIGGILGFVYAYFQKPVFIATTTFVLESNEGSGGGLGQYAGLASMVGIDLNGGSGGIFQGDNILELYKSRKMIQKTLLTPIKSNSNELLFNRYIQVNKLKEGWSKQPELMNLKFEAEDSLFISKSRLRDSILGKAVEDIIANYLTVTKPDKKLSIIKVDVKAKDEVFAKVFNDELVKNVNDFYLQTKIKKSLDNIEILEAKADSVRKVMNGAIYDVAAIGDATPNLNPTRQTQRVVPAQRAQFSAETNKSILSSLIQNLEVTKMSLLKETPLIQVIDQPIYPVKKEIFGKSKGAVIGCVLFGFVCILILAIRKALINLG
ncbi:GumC domain-containing protein [Pedobacter endophyticus]|uniref:Lipopolysaccharide biosynthesis protein n=1 Tax=Pedobacter endophyticus TaxID=2789740 RepID=A0A7U3SPW6_9SPHI|nr:lipopolysaccharide biosynthesis protein [Pedobacter endophyticus]QPH38344.1 lipopolysaccharide biosynthesis protein [Pedobacter endophyticus]